MRLRRTVSIGGSAACTSHRMPGDGTDVRESWFEDAEGRRISGQWQRTANCLEGKRQETKLQNEGKQVSHSSDVALQRRRSFLLTACAELADLTNPNQESAIRPESDIVRFR